MTDPTDLINPPPEGPYISIELRWGRIAGRPPMTEWTRETHGVGNELPMLKERALQLTEAKIDEGETLVACHIHHNGSQGVLMLGAWHYDGDVHEAPVWAPGASL